MEYVGRIKSIRNGFGFIQSELGEIYFKRFSRQLFNRGDEVKFKLQESAKKVGLFEATSIKVVKKSETTTARADESIIGIVKWFNRADDRGLILAQNGKTYLIYKPKFPIKEKMVVGFKEIKTKINRCVAVDLKLLNSVDRFPSMMNFLIEHNLLKSRNDVTEAIARNGIMQIFRNKPNEEILSILIEYFEKDLIAATTEMQISYLDLIKKIFENYFVSTCKQILSIFFQRYETILGYDHELQYASWLNGYIDKTDLGYVSEKLSTSKIEKFSNFYQALFLKLQNVNDQKTVLTKWAELIEEVDDEQYEKLEALLKGSYVEPEAKLYLSEAMYYKCDREKRSLMWLSGYTKKKDLSYIKEKLASEDFRTDFCIQIIQRLENREEIQSVINFYLDPFEEVKSYSQFQNKIEPIVNINTLDETLKKSLLKLVFDKSSAVTKYEMWLNGYTLEKDVNFMCKHLSATSLYLFERLAKITVGKLSSLEQGDFAESFLCSLGFKIDTSEKYSKCQSLVKLDNFDANRRVEFIEKIYNYSDSERQNQLWLDGHTTLKDLEYIVNTLVSKPIARGDKFINEIFSLLTATEQEFVIKKVLAEIQPINDSEKYSLITSVIKLPALNPDLKSNIVASCFENSDTERKYDLWLDGFTEKRDLNFIVSKLIRALSNINPEYIDRVFQRISNSKDQTEILDYLVAAMKKVDQEEKYNLIKRLLTSPKIDKNAKSKFSESCFHISDDERKFLMWLDEFTVKKEIKNLATQIFRLSTNLDSLEKIFGKLDSGLEHKALLDEIQSSMSKIKDYQDYQAVEKIGRIATIPVELRNQFIEYLLKPGNKYSPELFLQFYDRIHDQRQQILFSILNEIAVDQLFGFCIKLIDPLAKVSAHYPYRGYSYLKIYLEDKDYIEKTNTRYGYKSIFFQNGKNITGNDFDLKLELFKTIVDFMQRMRSKLDDYENALVSSNDRVGTERYLKDCWAYYFIQKKLCAALGIPNVTEIMPGIAKLLLEQNDVPQLLKLWVHDLIGYFDFNSYAFYYFTLSLEERKIFNRRAKVKMKEEIKNSMLKIREPWEFLEAIADDNGKEINVYSATWKSIWFGNQSIKICMNKNGGFSKSFPCEFSEESFNFLYEYLKGKRQTELKLFVSEELILKIEGLDSLEELIWKILILNETKEGESGFQARKVGLNRIPVNMILRNQCVQYLNALQVKELEPARVLERTLNLTTGKATVDVSLLYSIPLNEHEIAIIWESLELDKSKATHLFKCLTTNYEIVFSKIQYCLSTFPKIRSCLNSLDPKDNTSEIKLYHFRRIDHDNLDFDKWRNSLHDALPQLEKITQ